MAQAGRTTVLVHDNGNDMTILLDRHITEPHSCCVASRSELRPVLGTATEREELLSCSCSGANPKHNDGRVVNWLRLVRRANCKQ